MPSNSSDRAKLPWQLSTPQLLGFADPGDGEWSYLRGLRLARLEKRTIPRLLAHLVAVALATLLMAGHVPAECLIAWAAVAVLATTHSTYQDLRFARIRNRAFKRADFRRHTLGLLGCALVWAVPLLLADQVGAATDRLTLWMLVTILGAGLAFATRAAPLSTMLFVGITGLAGAISFIQHGEWALAALGAVFSAVVMFGTAESARSSLTAHAVQAGLEDKNALVSLLLREFEEHDADWLWQMDRHRRVRSVSQRFAYALGRAPEDVEGRLFLELVAGDSWASGDFAPSLQQLIEHVRHRQTFSDLLIQVNVEGRERWWKLSGAPMLDESGRFAGYRGVGSDVTTQRVEELRIAYLARHDALTGLPNRAFIIEALQDALRTVEPRNGGCSLLLVDLDRFKAVNDTLGHPIGDKLLVQVARRLQDAVGERGICGRLGGDEFAVVLPKVTPAVAEAVAETIIEQLSSSFEVDGHLISIGASIGSAVGPEDGTVVEMLMRHADMALYRAKGSGRGIHHRYKPELHAEKAQASHLKEALSQAIAREELALAFQPIVEAGGERLTGFEAFLRWDSEEHGVVDPRRCIAVAEAHQLISSMGTWVLHEACRQAVRWPGTLTVAVNLSRVQLLEPGFITKLENVLTQSGLPAQQLELEVLESMLQPDLGSIPALVQELRQLGCAVVVDNFGTGISSLAQLRRCRFSGVKIDRSFVRGAARGQSEEMALVCAVIAMSESTHMVTTAEGVETAEEAMKLRQLGCRRLQGYFYGRPMTGTEALALACRRPAVVPVPPTTAIPPAGRVAAA